MGRVMAIDYGKKRTGIAVTDPLRIIATPLTTIDTSALLEFITRYVKHEMVDHIVIGDTSDDTSYVSHVRQDVSDLRDKLAKLFPGTKVALHDEHHTSVRAKQIILQSGAGKKKRRDKKLTDKVAASLILHDYLETHQLWKK